jgi:dolichol kinase
MNYFLVLLMSFSFLTILFLAEVLYRFTKIPPEWTRKLQHVLSGCLAACFPWIFSSSKEVIALGVIMTLALFALRKSRFLTSLHDVKRETLGEFYFLLSAVILSILAWNKPPVFYFIPILTLTFSDSLAAIVGTAYKKHLYSIKGHIKSFEGSAAFFISTLFTVSLPLLFLSDVQPLPSILIALQVALITTCVEAVGRKGIDNLFIPLATFYLLAHLSEISTSSILKELIGCSAAFLVLYFFQKNRSFSIDSFSPEDERIHYFTKLKSTIYPQNASLESIHPEAVCLVALKNQIPLATLTIQKKGDVGLIGHYEASCMKAGVYLLGKAQEKLNMLGVKQILGPMNGNTWNRYRLAMDDSNSFFLGEPRNPSDYHDHFTKAGFLIAEKYESRIVTNLLERKAAYLKLDARMAKLGITIEPLKIELFESSLKEIYEMSLPAFAENRFYESITFEEFRGLYQKIRPLLDPDFIQLAYDKERHLVGYAFAYADAYDPNRLIFKTLATDKKVRANGLGVYLYDRMHWIAAEKGKRAVIHALMHEEHNSLKLSKSMRSLPFRDYALYVKEFPQSP